MFRFQPRLKSIGLGRVWHGILVNGEQLICVEPNPVLNRQNMGSPVTMVTGQYSAEDSVAWAYSIVLSIRRPRFDSLQFHWFGGNRVWIWLRTNEFLPLANIPCHTLPRPIDFNLGWNRDIKCSGPWLYRTKIFKVKNLVTLWSYWIVT